eukprot:2791240-Prymnesium_polylepis.1
MRCRRRRGRGSPRRSARYIERRVRSSRPWSRQPASQAATSAARPPERPMRAAPAGRCASRPLSIVSAAPSNIARAPKAPARAPLWLAACCDTGPPAAPNRPAADAASRPIPAKLAASAMPTMPTVTTRPGTLPTECPPASPASPRGRALRLAPRARADRRDRLRPADRASRHRFPVQLRPRLGRRRPNRICSPAS